MKNWIQRSMFMACMLASLIPTAQAVEVQFEGSYRARARVFDTLSLNRTLADSDGLSAYAQHRLWLRPKFLITDKVGVFVDIRALDGAVWGDKVVPSENPVDSSLFSAEDSMVAPDNSLDGLAAIADITLWRAWTEIQLPFGQLSFGRMPVHWGLGVWQNNGLGLNANYGDSVDRVAWEMLIQDQIFVKVAVDVNAEGFINETDNTTSFNAIVGYRSERVNVGLNAQLRYTPVLDLNLFTVDAAADAEMGKLSLHTELVGQFGSGNLANGLNGVNIMAFGAVLDAQLHLNPWTFQLAGGFASGDKEENDGELKTFTFDQDYNVGIVMFEHALPTLKAAVPNEVNAGRNFEQALTGTALSNAMYLRPSVSREIINGLSAEIAFLAARVSAVPDSYGDRKSYGMEFDTTLRYTGIKHVELQGTFGIFLPGTYYRDFESDAYGAFSEPVYGGEFLGRVRF